tara:strand:- start:1001 stop:1582 length:582 start_codon:yes stop_codon:yes gene_type:complete
MTRVYLDIETTGLNPDVHEIIEVAIVYDGTGPVYHRHVKPERIQLADPLALEINRFHERSSEWFEAISQKRLAFELAGLLKDKVVIGHNPFFDYSFIQELCWLHGEQVPRIQLIDTKTLAYEHLSELGLERLSLDSIRRFMGWSTYNSHTALKDAVDAQRLFHTLNKSNFIQRRIWKMKAKRRSLKSRTFQNK